MTSQVQSNVSLKPYNTFGVDYKARWFARVEHTDEVIRLLKDESLHQLPKLILGEGSNTLFTQNFSGLVLKVAISGIEIIDDSHESVRLKVGAGVNWHQLVTFCVANNYGGIENLSLIPGTVGAAPIQNIGAYGAEFKDVFIELAAIDLHQLRIKTFAHDTCEFGYRDSYFKCHPHTHLITHVVLELKKNPTVNTSYGAIRQTLASMKIEQPSVKDVSEAVIAIRQSKLPDPKKIGNAGSFFKNPLMEVNEFKALQNHFPQIPHYNTTPHIKIPAAWLIEQCGYKGKRIGNVGVHNRQAVVLVNHGQGNGAELKALAAEIQTAVMKKFNIKLLPEVNIV